MRHWVCHWLYRDVSLIVDHRTVGLMVDHRLGGNVDKRLDDWLGRCGERRVDL